ncbi:hypothetical protein C8Q75DRAFT_737106 [Abortiporus biennis]|nr:hypothetical protein C8Q75DRAFT_737106 [Abortiporus biennis]
MAQPQAYQQAYAQANKGTLMPGQMISVNKYTVQVERYLSQGGFAHVYLVRTAQPVYNTTHHVLKRIAVPNEAMLTEVKKEVDIMRILKGHPNIVHLIDAAWHRAQNGTYEVFILMEFCQGGGIIDMMNRRLRERLTEPEILTIFVDVCEGLAAMHSLKPPLLHRDLKVENILQASSTSYKLCDFGSATPVQKVPNSTQEIRMLEADLNRHTTLQYRAPEMVDVYLRRPIDEKSDVWALGVLLYKLCYYTTPFEEHGPLAILNVQYKIPPYPVYSAQMNALIASMLREYGTQRPTVFEILNHVHALRGTKSQFTYSIPQKQPSLLPRHTHAPPLQALSPNVASSGSSSNPLDDLVSFKSRSQPPSSAPTRNAGIEARDKVLAEIAPMRRGRPTAAPSPPASPKKDRTLQPFGADMRFGPDGDKEWSGVRGHKSGMASIGGGQTVNLNTGGTDAWGLSGKQPAGKNAPAGNGFENDFASFGKGFGDSFEPVKRPAPATAQSQSQAQPIPIPRPTPSPRPPFSQSPSKPQRVPTARSQPKDAFDGLGLTSQPPPQTLGDARKNRTGLAGYSATSGNDSRASVQYLNTPSGLGTSKTSYRPPSAHSHTPPVRSQPQAQPSQSDPWRPLHTKTPTTSGRAPEDLSAEERFPSLEDLDRKFTSPSPVSVQREKRTQLLHASSQPGSTERLQDKSGSQRPPSRSGVNMTGTARPNNHLDVNGTGIATTAGHNRYDGVRSQHVTGAAMRESRLQGSRQNTATWEASGDRDKDRAPRLAARPSLTRRHRSSISIKPTPQQESPQFVSGGPSSAAAPPLPPRPTPSPRQEPRDWLTGNSDEDGAARFTSEPILRESPSKRASYIEKSPVMIQKPLEAESMMGNEEWPSVEELERGSSIPKGAHERQRLREERERARERSRDKSTQEDKDRTKGRERRERTTSIQQTKRQSSPTKVTKAFITRSATGSRASTKSDLKLDTKQSSQTPSNGLTDNWSPVATSSKRPGSSSSSSQDAPEDPSGFRRSAREKTTEVTKLKDDQTQSSTSKDSPSRRRRKSKGRQSSVHDLVDLWGGGVDKDEKPLVASKPLVDKRRSAIVSSSSMRPPSVTNQPRSTSPQPITSPDLIAPVPTSSRFMPARPPSSQQQRKETSTFNPPPGAKPLPALASAGRSRPQSMFLNPVTKTAPLEAPITSPNATGQPSQTTNTSTEARSGRPGRRSSISDMVQRYEYISGKPTKPSALNLKAAIGDKSTGLSSGNSLTSPSSAAVRFPKISPTSSPVTAKMNLAVPESSGYGQQRDSSRGRTSPGPVNYSGRVSPGLSYPSRTDTGTNAPNGNTPARRLSPFEPAKSSTPAPDNIPPSTTSHFITRKATNPTPQVDTTEENGPMRSPSPEKPYQGVSRLIDRWQRAVDDNETPGFAPPRKVGAVGSLSGRR